MLKLTYSLSSLAPYLDEEVLLVHYNKIYKESLLKLNQLLKDANYQYQYSLSELVGHIDMFHLSIRGEILYYLSSVLNHNLYFYNISDQKSQKPIGKIKIDIEKQFDTFERFKEQFISYALNLKGSGYTFLVKDEQNRLKIINTSNEDSPYSYGFTPIICLDLWEHAYFLQYQTNRKLYIQNFFKIIDFDKINQYYKQLF